MFCFGLQFSVVNVLVCFAGTKESLKLIFECYIFKTFKLRVERLNSIKMTFQKKTKSTFVVKEKADIQPVVGVHDPWLRALDCVIVIPIFFFIQFCEFYKHLKVINFFFFLEKNFTVRFLGQSSGWWSFEAIPRGCRFNPQTWSTKWILIQYHPPM